MRLITIHGIGRTGPNYAGPLFASLRSRGRDFVATPIWWEPLDISGIRWWPLPAEWVADLWLSWSWVFRKRREKILQLIREAVEDGHNAVVVAHSHGTWLAIQALRGGPTLPLFVSLGRTSHRFGGLLFPGHHEIRARTWLNIYSTSDPLSGRIPEDHLSDVGVVRNLPLPLAHSAYWHSTLVTSAISLFWPSPTGVSNEA